MIPPPKPPRGVLPEPVPPAPVLDLAGPQIKSKVSQEQIRADYEALRVVVRKEAKAELKAAFRELNRQKAPSLERWKRAGQDLRVFK